MVWKRVDMFLNSFCFWILSLYVFFSKKGNGWKEGEKGKSFLENEMWSAWWQQNGETDGRRQDRDHVVTLPSLPDSRISFANTAKTLPYATRVTHRMFLLCTKRNIHKNVTHISLNCLLMLAENWNVVSLFSTTHLRENITFLPLGLLQPRLLKQRTSITAKFWMQVELSFLFVRWIQFVWEDNIKIHIQKVG